jgi:hypothetical protein
VTKQRITVGLAVLACALGATAVVKASIPDGGGVIHGCYKTNQGTLRVIDTALGQTCSNGETALNWSQTGPAGPQGAPGPQGPQGQQGPQGNPGPTYAAGTGIGLAGNAFDILGSYQLPQGCSLGQSPFLLGFPLDHPWSCFTAVNAGQNCSSNSYLTGFGTDGSLNCAEVPSPDIPPGPDGYVTRQPGNQDTPEGTNVTVATLSLPPGFFFVEMHGLADNDAGYGGDRIEINCWFGPRGFSLSQPFDATDNQNGFFTPFHLSDMLALSAPGNVTAVCSDSQPHTHVLDVQLTAVQLDSATNQ